MLNTENKCLNILIKILSQGEKSWKEIYKECEKMDCEFTNAKTWQSILRQEVYRHCSDCNSKFKPSVESEKDLFYKRKNGKEVILGLRMNKYHVDNEDIKDIEDIEEEYKERRYYEGIKKTVTTTTKKPIRNSSLVKDYKEYLRKKQNGKIYCEICGQWEQVEEMLELHHKVKITDYEKQNKEYSTFNDVILLCPNCHKLIHIFGSIEDVKRIYEN